MNQVTSFQSYQAGSDEPAQASSYQPARVTGETHRFTFSDGNLTQATTPGHEACSAAETSAFAGTSGFEATARNRNGTPVVTIGLDTIVTIDGVQAPVSSFVAAGRLTKAADGTFTEAATAAEAAPEANPDVVPMADDVMQTVNDALDTVPQESLAGLAAIGVGVAIGSIDPGKLAHRFTEISGFGGEEGAQRIATMQAAYQSHADAAVVARTGLTAADLPAFWEYARQQHRGELQQAVQRQLHANDVGGYLALAQRWQAATPPSVKALQAAGIPTRNQGQGVEVFAGGIWQTPKAAARVGLI